MNVPQNLKKLSTDKFFNLFANNFQKATECMRIIYKIDRDHNGYVTQTELDDILKMIFSAKEMAKLTKTEGIESLD